MAYRGPVARDVTGADSTQPATGVALTVDDHDHCPPGSDEVAALAVATSPVATGSVSLFWPVGLASSACSFWAARSRHGGCGDPQ